MPLDLIVGNYLGFQIVWNNWKPKVSQPVNCASKLQIEKELKLEHEAGYSITQTVVLYN